MTKIPWWRTSFGEDEARSLAASISAEHISQGPVTAEFERRIGEALDVPYAVVTTSGSVALLMALMALGIGRGDEVIVPNRTWIATAHAAMMLGAEVVLVDVLAELPVMDMSRVREKITSRTKAIMPVHLDGRAVDMDAIHEVSEEHGLKVVEDACQAFFSRNGAGFLGTRSDAGCFSLGVTKLISTGQGGVVVTRDEETYEKLKMVRNNGVVDHFDPTYAVLGLNFKFTDLLASIGMVQLSQVPRRIAHVGAVYDRYASAIANMELPHLALVPVNVGAGEVPLYVEVLCDQRDVLRAYLNSQGIESRPFLPNLSSAPYMPDGSFLHSDVFDSQGLFLPAGPDQPLENVDRVIEALRAFGNGR